MEAGTIALNFLANQGCNLGQRLKMCALLLQAKPFLQLSKFCGAVKNCCDCESIRNLTEVYNTSLKSSMDLFNPDSQIPSELQKFAEISQEEQAKAVEATRECLVNHCKSSAIKFSNCLFALDIAAVLVLAVACWYAAKEIKEGEKEMELVKQDIQQDAEDLKELIDVYDASNEYSESDLEKMKQMKIKVEKRLRRTIQRLGLYASRQKRVAILTATLGVASLGLMGVNLVSLYNMIGIANATCIVGLTTFSGVFAGLACCNGYLCFQTIEGYRNANTLRAQAEAALQNLCEMDIENRQYLNVISPPQLQSHEMNSH